MIKMPHSLLKAVLCLWLLTMNFAMAQSALDGEWSGSLKHIACTDTRNLLRAELSLQIEGKRVSGTIAYYTSYHNVSDLSNPLFEFPVSGSFKENEIILRYRASQETRNIKRGIGYYVMGGYTLILQYTKRSGSESLIGSYVGFLGARGELVLNRKEAFNQKVTNDPTRVLAKLRLQQQQRKIVAELAKDSSSNGSTLTSVPDWINANDSLKLVYESEIGTTLAKNKRTDSLFATWHIKDTVPYIDLNFYDNATIDNDTISLFVNDVLVLHKQPLSTEPLRFRVYKPDKDDTEKVILTIVAENLGDIPPNTALLQTIINGKIVRLAMSSSFDHNGKIECIWQF